VQIDNAPLTQLTIVGQVRKINPQATNITYTIDDGTATIDVKKWVDAERSADDADAVQFEPDQYVRVWGRLKCFNGKKHVGAHFIRAVEDYNEVSYHLVEAAYVHLYITRGPPVPGGQEAAQGGQQGQNQQQKTRGDGDSMFVDDGYGGGGGGGNGEDETPAQKLARASGNARKMFACLNDSPGGNEGLHINQIMAKTGLSTRDVFNAGDELNQLGLVYTTIDDETFAILEF
jgi:replication factor A2